jgi:hypothetical protein
MPFHDPGATHYRASGLVQMMLGSTPSGDAYTASEFESMGRQAGFARTILKMAEPTAETLVWFEN